MLQLVLSASGPVPVAAWRALLLGYCAATNPVDIVDKMLAGVDIRDAPAWASAPSPWTPSRDILGSGSTAVDPSRCRELAYPSRAAWRAGFDQFREQLALPVASHQGEVAAAMATATQLEHRILRVPRPPATVAEQVWIALRSQHAVLSQTAQRR